MRQNKIIGSALIAALFLSVFQLWLAVPVQACTTTPTGNPAPTLQEFVDRADVVFIGTVRDVEGEVYAAMATIEVDHYFKGGDGSAVVEMHGWGTSATCQASVNPGESWVFYGRQNADGTLYANWLTAGKAIMNPHGELLAELLVLTEGLDVQQPKTEEPEEEAADVEEDNDLVSDLTVTAAPAEASEDGESSLEREEEAEQRSPGLVPLLLAGLGMFACLLILGVMIFVAIIYYRRSQDQKTVV